LKIIEYAIEYNRHSSIDAHKLSTAMLLNCVLPVRRERYD